MGSHSVTCYQTQVNVHVPRPNPSQEAGTLFTYPIGMEGWVDLGYPAMERPRVELATCRSQVQHPNHYTTEPHNLALPWDTTTTAELSGSDPEVFLTFLGLHRLLCQPLHKSSLSLWSLTVACALTVTSELSSGHATIIPAPCTQTVNFWDGAVLSGPGSTTATRCCSARLLQWLTSYTKDTKQRRSCHLSAVQIR